MKPTHIVKTLDGTRYACELGKDELDMLSGLMQRHEGGIVRITHLVEDPNWQTEKKFKEKRAVLTVRSLCGIEEL